MGRRKDPPHTTATVRLCRVVGHRCPSAHDPSDLLQQRPRPHPVMIRRTRTDLPTCRRGGVV
jgi:hypothetical protein